MNVKLKQLYCI